MVLLSTARPSSSSSCVCSAPAASARTVAVSDRTAVPSVDTPSASTSSPRTGTPWTTPAPVDTVTPSNRPVVKPSSTEPCTAASTSWNSVPPTVTWASSRFTRSVTTTST